MDYDEEGMVLASALKTDGPTRDIPIIMLSGFNVQKDVREKVLASLMGQDWPAETFMQKPVRLAELAERIETLLTAWMSGANPGPSRRLERESATRVSCVQTVLAERGDCSRDQLIPLLQEIQAREGYLSQAAMTELAAALDTPVASVYGVATFYNQFRFAPLGRARDRALPGHGLPREAEPRPAAAPAAPAEAAARRQLRRRALHRAERGLPGRLLHRPGDQARRRVLRPPDHREAGRAARLRSTAGRTPTTAPGDAEAAASEVSAA